MVRVNEGIAQFRFFRPKARRVCLVGDFNDWRPEGLAMTPGLDGHWRARLMVPSGVYASRYYVDGRGHTDQASFGVEPGPRGHNSVLRVG
jgi:1,4-alpha-glucan branching enzyme